MLAWCTLILGLSAPGQTVGVAVFIDEFIGALDLSRSAVSGAYLVGTVIGAIALPLVGRWVDVAGISRALLVIGTAFGAALIATGAVHGIVTLALAFVGIRMLGQGAMTLTGQTGSRSGSTVGAVSRSASDDGVGRDDGARPARPRAGDQRGRLAKRLGRVRNRDLAHGRSDRAVRPRRPSSGHRPGARRSRAAVSALGRRAALLHVARRAAYEGLLGGRLDLGPEREHRHGAHLPPVRDPDGPGPEPDRGRDRLPSPGRRDGHGRLSVRLAQRPSVRPDSPSHRRNHARVGDGPRDRRQPRPVAYLYGFVFGLGMGQTRAISSATYPRWFGTAHIASIIGIAASIMVGSSAVGPLLLSLGNDAFGSYSPVILLCAALTLVVAAFTAMVKPPGAETAA